MTGIVGAYSKDAATKTYYLLINTQHRGQENCGLCIANNGYIKKYADEGLVSSVFTPDKLSLLTDSPDFAAIGSVGQKATWRRDIPPAKIEFDDCILSVAMDGMIMNRQELEIELGFKTGGDEEFFGRLFHKYLTELKDTKKALKKVMEKLDKAYYSLVMILNKKGEKSELICLRDKRGIKPMYFGKNKDTFAVSSESGAIDSLRIFEQGQTRDVRPGEMVTAKDFVFTEEQLLEPKPAYCAFEWVYTARPDAVIEGKTAHCVRKKLGEFLVKTHGLKGNSNSIIIGIPDSGRSVSLGAAEASGIPFDEGLIKNQYVGRTYIIPNQKARARAAMLKHNPIEEIVRDKRVIFGDDSIVRGTISQAVAKTLKGVGAKEIEMIVSYAPIIKPCFDDEPNKNLPAAKYAGLDIRTVGMKIAEEVRPISKVMFNSADSVVSAIGLPKEKLCTLCMTGIDPFAQ